MHNAAGVRSTAPSSLPPALPERAEAITLRARAADGVEIEVIDKGVGVDAHGGDIALESAPNEGTRARVRLPLAPTD